jgi:hypothetical protein
MSIRGLAVSLIFCSLGLSPAFAESSKVTTEMPPLDTAPQAHKPKAPAHAKKQTGLGAAAVEAKPSSQTIPMDFSSYDKKKPTSEPESTDSSGQLAPSLGTNSGGGVSPGMKFGF